MCTLAVVYGNNDNNRRWFFYIGKSSRQRWPEGGNNNIVMNVVYDDCAYRDVYRRVSADNSAAVCNGATWAYACVWYTKRNESDK